ncbi:Hypothetical predicted protein, partial [Paramuricea clavata]
VSHQLYANPERHFEVRAAGIAYMRDNPERFIEKTHEGFHEYHYVSTLPCTSMSDCVEIYPEQSTQSSQPKQTRTQYMNKLMKQKRANETQSPEAKEKRRVYAKEYRKRKRASESSQSSTLSIEAKQKKRLYAKAYRKRKQVSQREFSTLSIEAKQKKRLHAKDYRKQKRSDVVNTVNMLPRFPNETSTIKVNLKRRLQYKSSALSLNVRPNKVAEAAKWLVNNGNLYKDEGITFNDTWLQDNSNTQMLFDDSDNDQTSEGLENVVDCNVESLNCDTECKTQQSLACDDDEHWSEDEAEIPAGITDTMTEGLQSETQWTHLLRILGKLVNNKTYTDTELENLNWEEKNITCEKPAENPDLLALVNRQVHRHSHTCRKKSKSVYRFNYPQPPMRSNKILYPLDIDMDDNEVDQHKDTGKERG